MNQKIKDLWIEALLSGDYEQGQYRLNRDGRFCCLGVLCELHRKLNEGEGFNWTEPDDNEDEGLGYFGGDEVLPLVVQQWAGLSEKDPRCDNPFKETNASSTLANLNDDGFNFEQISRIIGKQI